jgi:toxin ParE1/3/4
VEIYAGILDKALSMIADDPRRPAALDRSDIFPGVRSLHLSFAAGRRHGAAHKVYFFGSRPDQTETVILRVLHERMEPNRRVLSAIRADLKGQSESG